MLKFYIDDNGAGELVFDGKTTDIIAGTCLAINMIYNKLHKRDRQLLKDTILENADDIFKEYKGYNDEPVESDSDEMSDSKINLLENMMDERKHKFD